MPILKQLGKTAAIRGKPKIACEYYDQVLSTFDSRKSLKTQDRVSMAEIQFLMSEALFDLGDLDHDNAGGNEGALFHAQEALK